MAKVIVRGGMPGKFRVELEGVPLTLDGNESSADVFEFPDNLNAYQTAHALQPFMQALADSMPVFVEAPAPVVVEPMLPPPEPEAPPVEVKPSARPSKAPKGAA